MLVLKVELYILYRTNIYVCWPGLTCYSDDMVDSYHSRKTFSHYIIYSKDIYFHVIESTDTDRYIKWIHQDLCSSVILSE